MSLSRLLATQAIPAAAWVIRGLVKGSGPWQHRIADQWYALSLGVAAVAAAGIAWVANSLLSDMGGYVVNRLPFYLTPLDNLRNDLPALWKVLEVFGANYTGLSGGWLALAFLHLASVLVVGWALVRVARRFFRVNLVDQVLAVAIVLNLVLYLMTNASDEAAHEVAIIVPFGAALAARVLVPTVSQGLATHGLSRRVRLAAAAGIVVLAGYTAGLGAELTQPSAPPANTSLASWLVAHHLTYGLSGYWTSSSVTVDSDGRVKVRALMQYTMQRDLWMSNVDWYSPNLHDANFIVLDSEPGNFSHWEPHELVQRYFGNPARTYQMGTYTIMVWNKNLLADVPAVTTS
jgi:hypothetical protein